MSLPPYSLYNNTILIITTLTQEGAGSSTLAIFLDKLSNLVSYETFSFIFYFVLAFTHGEDVDHSKCSDTAVRIPNVEFLRYLQDKAELSVLNFFLGNLSGSFLH